MRKGKRLGKNDRLFTWLKPLQKPRWLPQSWWKKIPDQLTVRVIRFKLCSPGYRPESVTLVTTLLDAQKYPAQDIAQLYARRWKIELWFRDLKTSMGMEVLRCKSPGMLHKELEMFFIAYNLIRCLIVQAGAINDVALDRMSFKGTVDSVRQFSLAIAQARSKKKQNQLIVELLEVIARDQVPDRPDRIEPRAVKRRPKAYQLLNRPRQAHEGNSPSQQIPQNLIRPTPVKTASLSKCHSVLTPLRPFPTRRVDRRWPVVVRGGGGTTTGKGALFPEAPRRGART